VIELVVDLPVFAPLEEIWRIGDGTTKWGQPAAPERLALFRPPVGTELTRSYARRARASAAEVCAHTPDPTILRHG